MQKKKKLIVETGDEAMFQWPISETNITCDSVTSFGGQIMEKTVIF